MSARLGSLSRSRAWRTVTAVWLCIAPLGGCASPYGGAERLPVRYEAVALSGYGIRYFDVVATRSGVRLHGRICREQRGARGISALRLERLSESGAVITVAEAHVQGLRSGVGRTRSIQPCSLFNADAPWRPTAGQTIRICTTDEARATAGGVCPRPHVG